MAIRASSASMHPRLTTGDLLAEAGRFKTAAAWAQELGITAAGMSQARRRGLLRPSHAAIMAHEIGEDAGWWIAVSAIDSQPEGPCKRLVVDHLRKRTSTRPDSPLRVLFSTAPAPRERRSQPRGTVQLLEAAAAIRPLIDWALSLGLSRNTLYAAKARGHLSPATAADLARELGEDATLWALVAALEAPGRTRQRLEHALYRAGIAGPFPLHRAGELASILGRRAAAILEAVIEPEAPSPSKDRVLARLRQDIGGASPSPRAATARSAAAAPMPTSLDLLTLASHAIDLSAWAADLGLNPNTTGQARRRGALSAALAGALAIAVEEDPIKWVQVAAIEAERDQALRQRMLHAMHDKSKGAS